MPAKQCKSGNTTKTVVALGAVTATVTAMTIGVAPPVHHLATPNTDVNLMAGIRLLPPPEQIPDITGGLGSFAYGFNQALAEVIERSIVEGANLSPLAGLLGIDPLQLVSNLLTRVPASLLPQLLGVVDLNIPLVDTLVDQVVAALGALGPAAGLLLDQVLGLLQLGGDTPLNDLLKNLLGIDLSNGIDLSALNVPGVNIVTAGSPFALLKMFGGVDLGWTPALPNVVAQEINNTQYLRLGAAGVIELLTTRLDALGLDPLGNLAQGLLDIVEALPVDIPNVLDLRIPVTVGFGVGAFSLATAYKQILDQLKLQPGGTAPGAIDDPVLGGITILPIVLINNLARPDGGLAARAYALAQLLGINTLNPNTHAVNDGGLPVLGTGLGLGGSGLIPVLVDVGAEYQPFSDFAAWPNAFTLFNNLAAGTVFSTYLLRGIDTSRLDAQLAEQLAGVTDNLNLTNQLAINLYLTAPANSLPLLEPAYLIGDALSLVSGGLLADNPITRLANALAPALTSLVNLGYTDAVRNPDGSYTRTLTGASIPTPFFSFPNVDPWQVLPDVVNQLVRGFQKEFASGNPTAPPPNAITGLLNLVNSLLATGPGGLGGGLGGLVGGLSGLFGGLLNPLTNQVTSPPPNALMAANSTMVTLSTETQDTQDLSKSGSFDEAKGDGQPGDVQGPTDPTGASGSELGERGQAGDDEGQPGDEQGKPGDEQDQTGGEQDQTGGEQDNSDGEQGGAGGDHGNPGDGNGKPGKPGHGEGNPGQQGNVGRHKGDSSGQQGHPRHAKPDSANGQGPSRPTQGRTPRHAKPDHGNGAASGSENNGTPGGSTAGASGAASGADKAAA